MYQDFAAAYAKDRAASLTRTGQPRKRAASPANVQPAPQTCSQPRKRAASPANVQPAAAPRFRRTGARGS